MNKRIVVWSLMLLFSVGLVNAALTDGLIAYYSFNANGFDNSSNGNDCANNGAVLVPGHINNAFQFVLGESDFMTCGDAAATRPTQFTIVGWLKPTSSGFNGYWLGVPFDDGAAFDAPFTAVNGFENTLSNWGIQSNVDGTHSDLSPAGTTIDLNSFQFIVASYNGSLFRILKNDSVLGTLVNVGSVTYSGTPNLTIGARSTESLGGFFDGVIDEVGFWDRVLTDAEITELFNNGTGLTFPFGELPDAPNQSLEQSFIDRQDAAVTIGGGVTTIISDTFNIPVNDSHLYVTASLTLQANQNNAISCSILFDGDSHGSTITRTNIAGDTGSLFLATTDINASIGDHDVELVCTRSSPPGNIMVDNGILILHNLIDAQNQTLNSTFRESNFSVNNVDGFPVLDQFIFTTSNRSTDENVTRSIVIDWDGQVTYNATSNITTEITIEGEKSCQKFPRFGEDLDVGVVGGDCVLENVSGSTDFNITIRGNGSGDVDMNIHVKEFYIENLAINSQLLNATTDISAAFKATILVNAFNMTINKTSTTGANLFVKVGIPVKSDSTDTLASCQLRINGPKNFTGRIHNRTVTDDGFGLLIVQDLFEDMPVGNYIVSLLGFCENGDCSTSPTEMVAYFTDREVFVPNFFQITAQNNRTLVAITSFNVTDSTFSVNTSTGEVNITTNNETFNFTVQADTFFDEVVLNHNTSFNITVNLTQHTIINATDFGGDQISVFTINFTQIGNASNNGTESTTTGRVFIPTDNGNYTINIFDVSSNGSFFERGVANITADPFLVSHTFSLFQSNTFHMEFLYEIDRTPVNDRNVTVQLVSSIEALNFSTDNGTLTVSALEPTVIDIRYASPGFRERSFFFPLSNQTVNNLTLYMLDNENGTLIIVTNVDETGTPQEGFITQLLKGFIIDSTEQFQVVEMDETDFAGEAVMTAQLNDIRYIVRTINITSNALLFLSNPFEITGTTLRVTLDLLPDPLASFNTWREIGFTGPTFNNASQNWTATYNDVPGLINPGGEVCLIVEEQLGVDRREFARSCASSTIATLTVQYTGSEGTFAKLVADTNTENSIYVIQVAENLIDARAAVAAALGGAGAFWSAAIIYGVSTMLIFNPATFMYGMIGGLIGVWLIGFASGTFSGVIALVIMGGVIIAKLRT